MTTRPVICSPLPGDDLTTIFTTGRFGPGSRLLPLCYKPLTCPLTRRSSTRADALRKNKTGFCQDHAAAWTVMRANRPGGERTYVITSEIDREQEYVARLYERADLL